MEDSLNICLSCGICSDGTLIGHVQLGSEELPRVKKIMNVESDYGNGFFLHPCSKYCNGCTIYSQRPKHCASFECGILKSVEQKELNFNSAVEIIEATKLKRDAIEKGISSLNIDLKSQSFYFKVTELKKALQHIKMKTLFTKKHLELESNIAELDFVLKDKFDLSAY